MLHTSINYTHALVSRIPNSLYVETLNDRRPKDCFDLDFARSLHSSFTLQLKLLGIDVIELAEHESMPFSCFVEDTVIINHGVAIMAKLDAEGRKKEVQKMKTVLRREGLHVISCKDPTIKLSGHEYIVGMSQFTNMAGAIYLAKQFPEYSVKTVQIPKYRHLKFYVTMAAENILAISKTYWGSIIKKELEAKLKDKRKYQTLTVPHDGHANCLWINKNIICVSRDDCKLCHNIFETCAPLNTIEVASSEFLNMQRGITSRVLLFRL